MIIRDAPTDPTLTIGGRSSIVTDPRSGGQMSGALLTFSVSVLARQSSLDRHAWQCAFVLHAPRSINGVFTIDMFYGTTTSSVAVPPVCDAPVCENDADPQLLDPELCMHVVKLFVSIVVPKQGVSVLCSFLNM